MECPPSPQYSQRLKFEAYKIFSSDDSKQMETFFSILFSSNEPQRSIANELLLCCKSHFPDILIIKLIFLLRHSANAETRAKSAHLLHLVKVQYWWPKLPLPTQLKIKSQLIFCLQNEGSMAVMRILCGVIAEIVCLIYKAQDQWGELFDLLRIFVSAENDQSQETALLVFANIPRDCRRLICAALSARFERLHSAVLRALSAQNVDVKLAAFGAAIGLIYLLPINELILQMLIGIYDLLKYKNEECAQKCLKILLFLVSHEPQNLKNSDCAHNLVFYVLKIMESRSLRDKTKVYVIQILMSFLKVKDFESMFQSLPIEFTGRLVCVSIEMLTGIKDDIRWFEMENEESEDAEKTESYLVGIEFLSLMPIVFGKKNILPIVLKVLPVYMDSREWQRRHAGIVLLGVISKDCSAEMILSDKFLNEVVKTVLRSFRDEHPRVCWAAFNFMHMAVDIVGAIQILHHTRIALALIDAFDIMHFPRVQEELLLALLSFIRSIPQDCLATYMDLNVVLGKLLALLKGDNVSSKCKTIGLRIFNFVVKAAGISPKNCVGYAPFLIEVCTHKNLELGKEAIVGIQLCVELGGPYFKPFLDGCLHKLGDAMTHLDRSSQDGLEIYDTIVHTLGTLYMFYRDIITVPKVCERYFRA